MRHPYIANPASRYDGARCLRVPDDLATTPPSSTITVTVQTDAGERDVVVRAGRIVWLHDAPRRNT